MKKILFAVTLLIAIVGGAMWLAYTDESTGAKAPNGEPIGAQHPRSERP